MLYLLSFISFGLIASAAYFLFRENSGAIDNICDVMQGAAYLFLGLVLALIAALFRIWDVL